ncbi:carbohydrate kinase, FGGY family protein, partial [Cooperia oncophora]
LLQRNYSGPVSNIGIEKNGFSSNCTVLPFLGDNPASLAGLNLSEDDVGISLGTSDTVFFTTNEYKPCVDAHFFSHFLGKKDEFMALVCFKNGSHDREQMCVNELGLYFDEDEIAPRVRKGDFRYQKDDDSYHLVEEFAPETEARALLEGQSLLKLMYAKTMGCTTGKGRLFLTGGASANPDLQRILSDVFAMDTYILNVPDSAALGGAMLARYAYYSPNSSYSDYYKSTCVAKVAEPNLENSQVYEQMLEDFSSLCRSIPVMD